MYVFSGLNESTAFPFSIDTVIFTCLFYFYFLFQRDEALLRS